MYDGVDLLLSEEGDLVIEDDSFALVSGHECIAQDILVRVYSNAPEWILHSGICANLEDLKGKRNTKELGDLAVEKVTRALTYDGRIRAQDLEVRVIPTSTSTIDIHIFVNTGQEDEEIRIVNTVEL
jgi:hypothetical protein